MKKLALLLFSAASLYGMQDEQAFTPDEPVIIKNKQDLIHAIKSMNVSPAHGLDTVDVKMTKEASIATKITEQWFPIKNFIASDDKLSVTTANMVANKAFEMQKIYNLNRTHNDLIISENKPLLYSLAFTALTLMIPNQYDRRPAFTLGCALTLHYIITLKKRTINAYKTQYNFEHHLVPIFKDMKETCLAQLEDYNIKQKFEKNWDNRERSNLGGIGHAVNNIINAQAFSAAIDKKIGRKNN
ncbi:MAG: hypothetical protein WC707_04575 [Candidatus Babeliaceae bacterium]|jgi:hypothetical protein